MDAQNDRVTYDLNHLAQTTPWSRDQWSQAQSWGPSLDWFDQHIPTILAMGGEPRAMVQILRRTEHQERGVLVGVDGMRARRYVEARAIAAVFEDRLRAVTELLEQEHWRADQAESELGSLEWGEKMPKVWSPAADEAPPKEVRALIDLNGGRVYARYHNTEDWYRPDAGRRSLMVYRWPIDDAGPFIALHDDWDFARIVDERARRADEELAIRDLCRHPGYKSHGSVIDFVRSQIKYDAARFVEQKRRAEQAEAKLAAAERKYVELRDRVLGHADQLREDDQGTEAALLGAMVCPVCGGGGIIGGVGDCPMGCVVRHG
jgi:hypothetical protein